MNTKQALEAAFKVIHPDAKFVTKEPFKPIIWWPLLLSVAAAIGAGVFMDLLAQDAYHGQGIADLNGVGMLVVFLICGIIGFCPFINDKVRASWTQIFDFDEHAFDRKEHDEKLERLQSLIGERDFPDEGTLNTLIAAYQNAMLAKVKALADKQPSQTPPTRLEQAEGEGKRAALTKVLHDAHQFGLNKDGWHNLAEVFKEVAGELVTPH